MMLSHMGRAFACLLAQSERRRYDRFSLLRKTDAGVPHLRIKK
jgi:hypothetical protein